MKERPLILITNDDGIESQGLRALAESVKELGEVKVVAPNEERSACSRSMSLRKPMKVSEIKKDFWSVAGTPVDCIMIALKGKLLSRKPDLVISGINNGPNLGHDIGYSGTCAGAAEATLWGVPSFAISEASLKSFFYKNACKFANKVAKKILEKGLPANVFLNVNIPAGIEPVEKYKIAKAGRKLYEDEISKRENYYVISGYDDGHVDIADSDCNVVEDGYISITPITIDPTSKEYISEFKAWDI